MRFLNPKQAIHDAYGIHLKSGDRMSMGAGTTFDSGKANFHAMKAGLVIKIVEDDLESHLRGVVKYCFAPDGCCSESEANAIQARLWADFMKANDGAAIPFKKQGNLVVLSRKVISNFRDEQRTGNDHSSKTEMAETINRQTTEAFVNTYEQYCKSMKNILGGYVGRGLKPIKALIVLQGSFIDDARIEHLRRRCEKEGVDEGKCVSYVNTHSEGSHSRIDTLSIWEADNLENYLDTLIHFRKVKEKQRRAALRSVGSAA